MTEVDRCALRSSSSLDNFGSLVFDRRTSRYAPFDHDTTSILRRAAQIGWFGTIAEEPDHERQALLADFLDHFEREGFFRADGRFAGVVLDVEPPRDHLVGPLAVHLEVIAACNLRCTHCFAGELPRKADLTLAEMDGLFGDLARLGSSASG